MKKLFVLFVLLCSIALHVCAQTYADSIATFREQYIKDLLAEPRHPVSASDVKSIKFFPPDNSYCIWADVAESPGSKPFLIQTHSGKQKPFREYGVLTFRLRDSIFTLHIYQSMDMVNTVAYKDELFIPFNDLTNYETTYAGGRYIDLSITDIKDHKVLLDFNKCYNPYCAYTEGFSCPIPPAENHLLTIIRAGERVFDR